MKNLMNKGLSVLLTLTIVLSAMLCSFTASLAAEIIYYVSATGSDTNNGTTQSTPVTSVAKAVELANLNYGEGDTVTIKVMGTQVDLGTIPVYAYDLIVEGVESTQTKLSIGSKTSADIANNETGTTRYKNVQFYTTQSSALYYMNSAKNVVFESDVTGFGGNKSPILGSPKDGGAAKNVAGQNIEFNNSNLNYIYVGNSSWQNRTITEDLTITVNTTNLRTPNFYFNPASGSSATYKKNLNLNIKSAKDVTFTNKGTVTVEGAMQIINSTSANITLENTVLSAINCEKYIIKNNTGNADILEFTDTKGKFKVNSISGYEIVATDSEGNITKESKDGFLVLPKAEYYTIALSLLPRAATYYVSSTGLDTNNGTTESSPVTSVAKALELANETYSGNDTITIKVMGTQVDLGTIPAYTYDLVIEGIESTQTKLSIGSKTSADIAKNENGTTRFKNVQIYTTQTSALYYLNSSKNVVFESDVTGFGGNKSPILGSNNDGGASKTIAGQNIEFNNSNINYIYVGNSGWQSRTYTEDLTITVNTGTNRTPNFYFNSGTYTATYNKNLNINIKSAAGATFTNKGTVTVEGAIQIINSTSADITLDNAVISAIDCEKYIIHNISGNNNIIDFTKTKGTFKVNGVSGYEVIVTDKDGNITKADNDGYIKLPKTGEYSLTAVLLPRDVTYYVSSTGSDSNDGTTESSPVTSVAKALELANSIYNSNDTVTIKLMGTQVDLGTIPAYTYDLVIEGIESTQTKLSIGSKTSADIAKNENGTTRFKNVQIYTTQSSALYYLNSSKNVIFESDVTGFGGNKSPILGSNNDGGASKTIAGQNIEFNNSNINYIYVGNSGWQSRTYTEDLTITVNTGTNRTPNFYFNSGAYTATYNKNLNINIKSAAGAIFTNKGTVTVEGAIQIINSTSADITLDNAVISAIDCEKYIIKNSTGNVDILEFTETKGKFQVNSFPGYEIYATDKSGNVTKAGKDGYLILPNSGEYELTQYRPALNLTYYVSAAESDIADGNKNSPFKTVEDAINAAVNAHLVEGDILTIKLIGSDMIEWGTTQTTPTHDFKLIVESYDKNNYSTVNIKHATSLGGTTELRYGVYKVVNQYSQIRFNDKNLTFGKGANVSCSYYTFGHNNVQNTVAGQKIVFMNEITSPYIYLSNVLHSNSKRYTEDLELVIDNPSAAPALKLTGQAGTVYYDANVNFDIKDANRITFGAHGSATNVCSGAIQLVVNSTTNVDPDGLEYLKNTCNPAKGFYHIINESEFKDILTFTTTAGKFIVDTEKFQVQAKSTDGIINAKDGYLVLPKADTYTLTATQKVFEPDNTIYQKLDGTTIDLSQSPEITIDNEDSIAVLDFGTSEYQDVKINILNAKKVTFKGAPILNGSLHIAINSKTEIVGKEIIDNIVAYNGKWYIVNQTESKLSFGEDDGGILYTTINRELEAVTEGSIIAPKFKNFLLIEGDYTVRVKQKGEDQFSDYIDYRGSGLANTYAKINNNQKLNVVYIGGSVTDGTGSSSSNASWRGLIGQWLENTYPNANINNMNSAIGATGTSLGVYRLNRHLIAKKPDLLFIEFSINDFLDLHHVYSNSYELASRQMETIIRTVRKELPECDIVMLHTVNNETLPKIKQGQYYTEAQAHNDIAKAYNIPTINVGKALVDVLPDDWESMWDYYVTDSVHPSDAGYKIYFNVLKEYVSNCLLYTEHSGEIKKHTVPQMVNHSLVDGDVMYHDASKELLQKSIELGGSGFEYSPGEKYTTYDFGCIKSTNNSESVFAFEFVGTEVVLVDTDSNQNGYYVKVDDGEWYFVKKSGMTKPRVMASGLESGKHVVYIKPSSESGTVEIKLVSFYTRDDSKATYQHIYDDENDNECNFEGCGHIREVNGDINKDNVFDIRDLVCAEMVKDNTIDIDYNFKMADRNEDGIVNDDDIDILRIDLLAEGDSVSTATATSENPEVLTLKSPDANVEKKALAIVSNKKEFSVTTI